MCEVIEMNKVLTNNISNYNFSEITLSFSNNIYENVFYRKNNKILKETLEHEKYQKLKMAVLKNYSEY
jgi:hypothetical protein